MREFSGDLNDSEMWDTKSEFKACFGDIIISKPWSVPTRKKVKLFQSEWLDSCDFSSHEIWLVGGFREGLERQLSWKTWDVDYLVNGPINFNLQKILINGLKIGFSHNILVDVCHISIKPFNYANYQGITVKTKIIKSYNFFKKSMNGKYHQIITKDSKKISGLELYVSNVEWPSKKQLARLHDWYQFPPIKINTIK